MTPSNNYFADLEIDSIQLNSVKSNLTTYKNVKNWESLAEGAKDAYLNKHLPQMEEQVLELESRLAHR